MKITTVLANNETSNIIKNIYPLYLHDLSEHCGDLPNEYGIYEEEPMKTLADQYEVQNIWFEKANVLFPYIIRVDDKPAGFILIATKPYAPKTSDYYVNEFFLLRPYRGKNIGEIAAKQVFDKFQGRWELYTNHLPKNLKGQKFWRKTVSSYTNNNYDESTGQTVHEEKLIFRFNNKELR
ncbi:GNAT family N-acetyltransferase [Clostridium tagluense]|uniref:GNAT family N-acetyltransferase n=1 Tax=Clostridium TaxID=1485 RepID=UPI0013E9480E|nr:MULTISPECIES: GNAT family N-acetyltransferase [Clostridium]MBU3127883.1 GNAT family N-acetyltransferase [Clostridium tagluense]MBW9159766.1 GNAT family N-acetyltransferase [Clostridium tagluense]MBZ9634045.1 GNAT family N-acetyltransferase [Clostridium sp. FP1]MBZ9634048.1 GNAT family N-acetyltransferase [Clostridium sp. FP1]MCB2312929.1 GNAT family N-acetyltransferase [Clostridium tagluense]